MEITVTTQAEIDSLPSGYSSFTTINIKADARIWLSVSRVPQNAQIVAWGSSHVVAWGSSHVVAWGSSHVVARESSHVVARGSSHVVARGSSHVVARESSHVVARGSSHVEAGGSSHVEAGGFSHVVARESSHVVARGSSHVVARESSHVEAWESSHVEAWGSSHVEARGSSHVEARESVSVQLQSDFADVLLFDFAVCIALAKGKIKKESKTATIVRPKKTKGLPGWFDTNGVKSAAKVVLFKRVSKKFQTQEGKKNETTWSPGSVLALANPNFSQECGEGKFHACSRAYHCDEFRSVEGDRYVAIEVLRKDLHAFDKAQYPYKIAFSRATVLHECDRFGNKI